jgi:alkanesulfonate monooxygenase SsuD/methylene tetrahydromethanopterin reductase-like flavin-dependent oxidoreductase (luciferase family)
VLVGTDRDDLFHRAAEHAERFGDGEDAARYLRSRAGTWLIGTVPEVVERLQAYQEAGVERVMLQHLAHEDLETVEMLGAEVAPAVG